MPNPENVLRKYSFLVSSEAPVLDPSSLGLMVWSY